MPTDPRQPESIAAAIGEISESLTRIVQDEIALAKAEVAHKFSSIARGAAAVAAGAVFGVFAIIFGLSTLAWGLDAILVGGAGNLFLGFLIVFGVLIVLAVIAFLFAWRKLKVGAPIPSMAIDEAKKVQATVTTQGGPRPGIGD
ncbi:MAG TPA: phage holin family protein [Solirubrobacteraceae bacterium]|nr:phage holin family protein [Solirubrobacteraceae bacterium]